MSQSKEQIIEERRANLPLPDQPPTASDWQSANARNVNVGSGSVNAPSDREPATGDSSVRTDGEEWNTNTVDFKGAGRSGHEGLGGLPNDAVTRDAKNASGTVETTGKDYGYPEKNDPSRGPN